MCRFILVICLMSGWSGLSVAQTQTTVNELIESFDNRASSKTQTQIGIRLKGTGKEKNVEDFKDHVPMIQRHFELSQSFIEKYAIILFMQDLKTVISDVKKYLQLKKFSSENAKNQIKDLEKNNFVLRGIENKIKRKPNFTHEEALYRFHEIRESFYTQVSDLNSLTALNESLTYSNQCLNAAKKVSHSKYLKQIKDICRSSKDKLEEILPLEKARLKLFNSEKCNHEIKCLKYNELMDQIENKLNAITLINENRVGNQILGWRKDLRNE